MAIKELRIFNNDNLDQERDHLIWVFMKYGYKEVQSRERWYGMLKPNIKVGKKTHWIGPYVYPRCYR